MVNAAVSSMSYLHLPILLASFWNARHPHVALAAFDALLELPDIYFPEECAAVLELHGGSSDVVNRVLRHMNRAADEKSSHGAAFVAAGGLPLLVAALTSYNSNQRIVHSVLVLLNNLSVGEGVDKKAVAAGCVAPILAALIAFAADVESMTTACVTIYNLTLYDSSCRTAFFTAGVVPLLVSGLERHLAVERAAVNFCDAIFALTTDSVDISAALYAAGAIPLILAARTEHGESMQAPACAALLAFAVNSSALGQVVFDVGGITVAMDALKHWAAAGTIRTCADVSFAVKLLYDMAVNHPADVAACGCIPLLAAHGAYFDNPSKTKNHRLLFQLLAPHASAEDRVILHLYT